MVKPLYKSQRETMKLLSIFLTLFLLTACGAANQKKKIRLELKGSGEQSVLVQGAIITDEFKKEAQKLNIRIEGETLVKLTGDANTLTELEIPVEEKSTYIQDHTIEALKDKTMMPDFSGLYMAKKEFGIHRLQNRFPKADGRGVIVGVIDDGISPHQKGFQVTSAGERKLLEKGSNSSSAVYSLTESDDFFVSTIKEFKTFTGILDINRDGKIKDFKAQVSLDGKRVCLDLNTNDQFENNECRGDFKTTGEYFLIPNTNQSLTATVDLNAKKLRLSQSERGGDSHGEGVASVMSGFNMGGVKGFDGVAPGSQILDYDLSETSHIAEESEYTLGTFLMAIDWLAGRGAKVINVSYSLFFTSAKTQEFMSVAIDEIVKKHNVVLSFSAGNNGPGLGSLNRRLIYPASTLVAGAYVSKELDERVHGVTGIPEEGRMVYYSSLGPGAGAGGPLLIAPLSNLTYSTPDTGMASFSGTSSASPALAGAATVLMSAIISENLPLDAATVVAALRLSGRQIANEPFIAQGYGLPQLDRAFDIYKSLIMGEEFSSIDVTVNQGHLDGATPQGIFMRTSKQSHETFRLALKGVISKVAPANTSIELTTPIRLEYTAGIKGPQENWISSTASRLHIDVTAEEVLNGGDEGFGEIRIYSQLSHKLLAIVPVTVINDHVLNKNVRKSLKVSSQEGARIHLDIPAHVKGVKVNARLLKGQRRILNFATYNEHFIRTRQMAFTSEFILPTPNAGHYQLALLMAGGTESNAEVEFDIEPISFELETTDTSSSEAVLRLNNNSETILQGDIYLTREMTPIASRVFNQKQRGRIELEVEPGSYTVEMSSTKKYDLSYLRQNCSIMEKKNGEYIPTTSLIYQASIKTTLLFQCIPFDFGAKFTSDEQWLIQVKPVATSTKYRFDQGIYSEKDLVIGTLSEGTYLVEFATPFSTERISLGKVNVW